MIGKVKGASPSSSVERADGAVAAAPTGNDRQPEARYDTYGKSESEESGNSSVKPGPCTRAFWRSYGASIARLEVRFQEVPGDGQQFFRSVAAALSPGRYLLISSDFLDAMADCPGYAPDVLSAIEPLMGKVATGTAPVSGVFLARDGAALWEVSRLPHRLPDLAAALSLLSSKITGQSQVPLSPQATSLAARKKPVMPDLGGLAAGVQVVESVSF